MSAVRLTGSEEGRRKGALAIVYLMGVSETFDRRDSVRHAKALQSFCRAWSRQSADNSRVTSEGTTNPFGFFGRGTGLNESSSSANTLARLRSLMTYPGRGFRV